MFSSVPFASYSFGILLVYALGSFLQWRIVAAVSAIMPILSMLSLFLVPESPVWLIRSGKYDDATESLIWLSGGDHNRAKREAHQLIERVNHERITSVKISPMTFFKPEILKPLLIINVFNVLQVLSGTYLIVFYAVDIISNVQGDNIDHLLAAVLTACVRFLFTVGASILLTLIGRRTLAISSGLGTFLSSIYLAIVLQQNCQVNSYVVALVILIYVAMNTVGFLILPGVMVSELLPAKIRGQAGAVSFTIFNLSLFGAAKMFPELKVRLGISGVFWLFATASFAASIFLFVTLPETKGKTLCDIEDYFCHKNFCWISRNRKLGQPTTEKESLKV